MILILCVSMGLGALIAGLSGFSFLFWIITIGVFICMFPFLMIDSYVEEKTSRAQYQEERRQRERNELLKKIAREHNEKEDRRNRNLVKGMKKSKKIVDNRQIHIHERGAE